MRPSGCNDGIKKKKEQQKLPDNLRQKQHTYILAVQNYNNNTKEKTEKDKKKKNVNSLDGLSQVWQPLHWRGGAVAAPARDAPVLARRPPCAPHAPSPA